MAQTSYIDLTPEQEELFFKGLSSQDRFVVPRVRRKLAFVSVKRKKGLTQRSLLPQVSEIWNSFSDSEKQSWKDAGAQCHMKGYNLFVQDQCIRIKNDYSGVATPSLFHQSWVGFLNIEHPASEIKIAQYHPRSYWVLKSVKGKKGMKAPVLITEDFNLPLEIKLSYKSDLSPVGENFFAKFYAAVRSSYQGLDTITNLEINLPVFCRSFYGFGIFGYSEYGLTDNKNTDWVRSSASLSNVLGYVIGYTLYFHLYGLQGTLFFDNIEVNHSSQNWARDPYCKNINEGFTRAFFQVPKHWVGVEIPDGSSFESIYPI